MKTDEKEMNDGSDGVVAAFFFFIFSSFVRYSHVKETIHHHIFTGRIFHVTHTHSHSARDRHKKHIPSRCLYILWIL